MTTAAPPVPIHDDRVDAAATAKLIRRQLAATFGGTRFSVRTRRYAGGSSVDVTWTDGPTEADVDKLLAPYTGKTFDGMQDLATFNYAWLNPATGDAEVFVTGLGQWGGDLTTGPDGRVPPDQAREFRAGARIGAGVTNTDLHGVNVRSSAYSAGYDYGLRRHVDGWRLVTFGAHYVITQRRLSDEFRAELERAVLFLAISPPPGPFRDFGDYDLSISSDVAGGQWADDGGRLVWRLAELDDAAYDRAMAEEAERRAIVREREFHESAERDGDRVIGFYVTVVDHGRTGRLLGPYPTKEAAETDVRPAKVLAESVNDRAIWYAYGVSKWASEPDGILERGLLEHLPARQLALAGLATSPAGNGGNR